MVDEFQTQQLTDNKKNTFIFIVKSRSFCCRVVAIRGERGGDECEAGVGETYPAPKTSPSRRINRGKRGCRIADESKKEERWHGRVST